MIKVRAVLVTLLVVSPAWGFPVKAYAVPFLQQDVTFSSQTLGELATVNIKVFAPGVSSLAEDSRFASVTPGASDFTYFYRLTNTGTVSLTSLSINKLVTTSISAAGVIGGPAASIFPTRTFFNFGSLDPFSAPLDLFITSSHAPNTVGALLRSGAGLSSASFYGPNQAVPEPGTLILIGSGFLGFALLSRNKFIRH